MSLTPWTMKGWEVVNCNCNYGCPCQFNQLPTHGNCCAHIFVHIDEGRYGDVPLSGLRWGIVAAWPGAVHQGNGTMQVIVDERADARQRAAIEAVAKGQDTEPMKLVWSVFAAMTKTFLPTITAAIDISADFNARTATVRVPGLVTGDVSPITNPVTGAEHRARIVLPNGMEFSEAECASGTATVSGALAHDFTKTHAHLARVHWSTNGVVRASA